MRFNEFNKVNEDVGLPTEKGTTKDWMAKSAASRYRDPYRAGYLDPTETAYQEKPAYQRAGKPEPITRPVPGTKPSVNLSDPKQAAAYKAALAAEKPVANKATGSVGNASPGEPTMGLNNPEAKIKSGVNTTVTRTEPTMEPSGKPRPSNIPTLDPVKDAAPAAGKAATKSLGRRVLGKAIPYVGSGIDAEEAYNRYQRGDRSGAVISALGAVGGLVPGLGTPVAYGAMGLNAIKDATGLTDKEEAAFRAGQDSQMQSTQQQTAPAQNTQAAPIKTAPTPRLTQQQMAAVQAAPSSGSTAQRSTYTTDQQAIKDRISNTQDTSGYTPNTGYSPSGYKWEPVTYGSLDKNIQAAPAQKNVNTGIEQPRQPRQSYAGTPGAQAIQRANPDTIKNVNSIKAGDTINLPNGSGQYVVKHGDTLDQIARNQLTPSTPSAPSTPSTPSDAPTWGTPLSKITAKSSSAPIEYDDNDEPIVRSKSSSTGALPTEKVKETSEDKALNRIKSLAGLK